MDKTKESIAYRRGRIETSEEDEKISANPPYDCIGSIGVADEWIFRGISVIMHHESDAGDYIAWMAGSVK